MSLLFLSDVLGDLRARDSSGRVLPFATLTFWRHGTTAPLHVYSDQSLTQPLTDADGVLTADSAGTFPRIYLQDSVTYRVTLRTAAGVLVWDCDPYICDCASPPYVFRFPLYQALADTEDDAETHSGARIRFYVAGDEPGSTVPALAYADSALTRPHPNPLSADSGGLFPPVYLDDAVEYRIVLEDYAGTVLLDLDPYVCQCGFLFLTSRPYPIETIEAMQSEADVTDSEPFAAGDPDAALTTSDVLSGELREPLIEYDDGEPEALDTAGDVLSGTLDSILVEYKDGEPEAMDTSGDVLSGTLDEIVIAYNNSEPEALDTVSDVQSGTLV